MVAKAERVNGLDCDASDRASASAPRRQHRSRRHHPQRARRAPSRSGARRQARDRGRRRRHHRASARGPPPHPRRRHRAAEGGDRQAAQFRNGGDRRDGRDRAARRGRTPPASCRRSASERTTEGGLDAVGQHDAACAGRRASSSDAGIRVSLFIAAEPRADRGGGGARRAGGRTPHRRLVRRAGRRARRRSRGRMAAHPRRARSWRKASASKSTPATASTTPAPRPIAALPQIVELNIGHFLIGEAVFDGLAETRSSAMRAAMDRGRAKASSAHDHRPRLRPHRRPPHRATCIERHGERFLDRIFTADRARQGGAPRQRASRPTPSASPPRRPAPRRSAPASAAACSGATWAWSICRPGGRPCS